MNPTFEVIGGIISAVISAVALFMYHWSIVFTSGYLYCHHGPCCRLYSPAELTEKPSKCQKPMKISQNPFLDLLSGYDTSKLNLFKKNS